MVKELTVVNKREGRKEKKEKKKKLFPSILTGVNFLKKKTFIMENAPKREKESRGQLQKEEEDGCQKGGNEVRKTGKAMSDSRASVQIDREGTGGQGQVDALERGSYEGRT